MKRTANNTKEFAAAQLKYCQMMAEGKGIKAALEATGLSHSQGDWAWYSYADNPNRVDEGSVVLPPLPPVGSKDDPGYEVALRVALQRRGLVVGELRKGEHKRYPGRDLSFGQIAVVCNVPEGQVHKAFTALGISSHGTRKNHGGRWLGDDPRKYKGNRKGIGLEHPAPHSVDPKVLEKDNDTVKSVLPTRIQDLRKQVAQGTTRKARATKKAPAKRARKAS